MEFFFFFILTLLSVLLFYNKKLVVLLLFELGTMLCIFYFFISGVGSLLIFILVMLSLFMVLESVFNFSVLIGLSRNSSFFSSIIFYL